MTAQSGAIVRVLVGVSDARSKVLTRLGFPVPAPVPVWAQLDTGATVSAFSPVLFEDLQIPPVDCTPVLTPSTAPDSPHHFNFFHVSVCLFVGDIPYHFSDWQVMSANCWHESEEIEALIGRDILGRCTFQYLGRDETFSLEF
jgi:hypothetical protein